jgi:hypothetical protein
MTISYEAAGPARMSPFPAAVTLAPADAALVFSVLDKVARSACHRAPDPHAGERVARAGAAFRLRFAAAAAGARDAGDGDAGAAAGGAGGATPAAPSPADAGSPPIPVDAVLDLAAELVESADTLLSAGLDLEALALEGVSGRLTELLLGAGPYEGTPLGGRR